MSSASSLEKNKTDNFERKMRIADVLVQQYFELKSRFTCYYTNLVSIGLIIT